MDRRRFPRANVVLPVRVWGMDAHSRPFIELARIKNISNGGAVIQGLARMLRVGEVLDVQLEHEKAQFCVAWVGKAGTRREGEVGLSRLFAEPCLWDVNPSHCSRAAAMG